MAAYPNDGNQSGLYTAEGYENTYAIDPGVCILPLAEDPPTDSITALQDFSPVVVLRLHAPYRVRKMTHLSEKKNNPPPMPSYADTGRFVFMGGEIGISNTLNANFRAFDWKVQCDYLFVESCVCREEDGYVLGTPPWTWATDTINAQSGYIAPEFGAVASAGLEAIVGFTQGLLILADSVSGNLSAAWGYNVPGYYPGTLVYSDLPNSGPRIL